MQLKHRNSCGNGVSDCPQARRERARMSGFWTLLVRTRNGFPALMRQRSVFHRPASRCFGLYMSKLWRNCPAEGCPFSVFVRTMPMDSPTCSVVSEVFPKPSGRGHVFVRTRRPQRRSLHAGRWVKRPCVRGKRGRTLQTQFQSFSPRLPATPINLPQPYRKQCPIMWDHIISVT